MDEKKVNLEPTTAQVKKLQRKIDELSKKLVELETKINLITKVLVGE